MDEVVLWALVAAGLAVGEVLTLSLVAGMLGLAALVALLVALTDAGLTVQLLAFAASAVLLLGVVRPVAQRHLRAGPTLANDPGAALAGATATVVHEITDDAGQVRVNGELWRARPAVQGDVLPVGCAVWIDHVAGATVHVYPKDLHPHDLTIEPKELP